MRTVKRTASGLCTSSGETVQNADGNPKPRHRLYMLVTSRLRAIALKGTAALHATRWGSISRTTSCASLSWGSFAIASNIAGKSSSPTSRVSASKLAGSLFARRCTAKACACRCTWFARRKTSS